MRPFSFALTLGAVAALRVAPLRMSATATEAAAKAKWLAKTAKPTFTGKVVATNAIAPPAPQAAAYAYEDRVLGRTHGGPTAYERSMLHPSTHWGVVATAGTRDAAPFVEHAPSFSAATPGSAAAPAAKQAAYAYEDRVLGKAHGGPTAYERSMLHPSTHWGVVATAGVVPPPATPTIPSFTAPAAAQEAQQAAAAYEDRVLGRAHGSRTAYEYGIEHPSTQWGVSWR
jgi:hypothetical protein|eukprot:jgi/Chrpa1/10888/Chrysochromulina_OHIO_Genome00020913-RA